MHRLVQQALREREAASIDDLRTLQLSRLDAIQAAHWYAALEGDLAAASLVIKIIDRRIFGTRRADTADQPGMGTLEAGRALGPGGARCLWRDVCKGQDKGVAPAGHKAALPIMPMSVRALTEPLVLLADSAEFGRHRIGCSGLQSLSQYACTSPRLTNGSVATACSARLLASARNVIRPPVRSSNGPPT
jgi:hypothetical protein